MSVFFRRLCGCSLILVFGVWIATAVVAAASGPAGESGAAATASVPDSMGTLLLGLLASFWILCSVMYGIRLAWQAKPMRLSSMGELVLTAAFVAAAVADRLARVHGSVHVSADVNAYTSMLVVMVALVIFAATVDVFMPPWSESTH